MTTYQPNLDFARAVTSSLSSVAILDTDPGVVDSIALALRDAGFTTHAATVEDHARRLLVEERIDILIGSTRLPLFALARRQRGIVILALTQDGGMPGYLVCRSCDRAFSYNRIQVGDIVAHCRLLAARKELV